MTKGQKFRQSMWFNDEHDTYRNGINKHLSRDIVLCRPICSNGLIVPDAPIKDTESSKRLLKEMGEMDKNKL
jgi:hypothetical protein